MGLFVLECLDRPGALDLRLATRAAHLDYIAEQGAKVKAAGALLDAQGAPTGSLLIVEAPDAQTVEALAASDPFALAGVFAQVRVRAWRLAVGSFAAP